MEGQAKLHAAEQFVSLGYGDIIRRDAEFWSTQFRTDQLTTPETQVLLRLVKSYNAFSGDRVAAAIEEFKGRVTAWEFGREGSPVVYVLLPYTTNQIEGQRRYIVGNRIPEEAHAALLERLQIVFQSELGASEFTLDDRQHYLRVWWD
ncbi:MAG: hypothetical protein H7A19_17060 [Rhodanobacteraceae bacterium]|nr:hypothetical protein [Rhodanobacteraceae bacterium]